MPKKKILASLLADRMLNMIRRPDLAVEPSEKELEQRKENVEHHWKLSSLVVTWLRLQVCAVPDGGDYISGKI